MSNDIWVLGATGRAGHGIARRLHETGQTVVLAGRDATGLAAIAAELGGAEVISGSFESLLSQMRRAGPAVVVSTIGPFARTSVPVIAACPPGTHYVDIGNELPGVRAVLDGHEQAVAEGSTVVTGAGFGVIATESVVLHICEGLPAPARVRVDAIPSLATEKGAIGSALAGSMLDSAPEGGRRVEHGRLVRSAVAAAREQLTTPRRRHRDHRRVADWRPSCCVAGQQRRLGHLRVIGDPIQSRHARRLPGAVSPDALLDPAALRDRSRRPHSHTAARACPDVLMGTRHRGVERRHGS